LRKDSDCLWKGLCIRKTIHFKNWKIEIIYWDENIKYFHTYGEYVPLSTDFVLQLLRFYSRFARAWSGTLKQPRNWSLKALISCSVMHFDLLDRRSLLTNFHEAVIRYWRYIIEVRWDIFHIQ